MAHPSGLASYGEDAFSSSFPPSSSFLPLLKGQCHSDSPGRGPGRSSISGGLAPPGCGARENMAASSTAREEPERAAAKRSGAPPTGLMWNKEEALWEPPAASAAAAKHRLQCYHGWGARSWGPSLLAPRVSLLRAAPAARPAVGREGALGSPPPPRPDVCCCPVPKRWTSEARWSR